MKADDLAKEFVRVFAAAIDLFPTADVQIRSAHSTDDLRRPQIIFDATLTPLDGAGRYLSYTLMITPESNAADEETQAIAHDELVSRVQQKLFGTSAGNMNAAKVAFEIALNAGGIFESRNYDMPPEPIDPTIESNRFRTPMTIKGMVKVISG